MQSLQQYEEVMQNKLLNNDNNQRSSQDYRLSGTDNKWPSRNVRPIDGEPNDARNALAQVEAQEAARSAEQKLRKLQALFEALQTELRTAKTETDNARKEATAALETTVKARTDAENNLSWFIDAMNQWSTQRGTLESEIQRLQSELRRFMTRRR